MKQTEREWKTDTMATAGIPRKFMSTLDNGDFCRLWLAFDVEDPDVQFENVDREFPDIEWEA